MLEGFEKIETNAKAFEPRITKDGKISIPLSYLQYKKWDFKEPYCELYYNPKDKVVAAKLIMKFADNSYRLQQSGKAGFQVSIIAITKKYHLKFLSKGAIQCDLDTKERILFFQVKDCLADAERPQREVKAV